MAIYGSEWGNISGATQVNRANYDVSTASTTFQDAYTVSLVKGMYMASYSYTPSNDASQYPAGDADNYECRVTLDGTELGATLYTSEGNPLTYQNASALTVIFHNNATNDFKLQYRTTDADTGGCKGYLKINLSRLMGYT